MDQTLCRQRIMSEDYRDFIVSRTRPLDIGEILPEQLCEQEADYDYRCVYLPKVLGDPINLDRFFYTSIPKCYTLLSMETMNQAGILPIQNYPTLQLKGNGVLIGFIDTGIDYTNSIFRNLDGSSRIMGIWDQTIQEGTPPPNLAYGSEYTKEMIDRALREEDPKSIVPSEDTNGHGTFVASLAAGSGNPAEQFIGAAPEASLAVVKLKPAKQYLRDYYFIPDTAPCYQETDVMLGLRYLNELAERLNMPLIMCIAVGTNMGGHIGVLPLSSVIEYYGTSVNRIPVIGVGNEADQRHHFSHPVQDGSPMETVEIRVGENVEGFTMELWTEIPNVLSISLISPSGETTPTIPLQTVTTSILNFILDRTQVSINYRIIVERSTSELVHFRFRAPTPGIWRLIINPERVINGLYHIWLPVKEFLSGEVYFLSPDPYYTLTNPANTASSIVVSYYDGNTNSIALSSGRGYTRNERINPDITAPGINVKGGLPRERFAVRSGSSISTAITAGAAALLMEWVVFQLGTQGIDSYQIKSLFILGAVRPGFMTYPNREWGYGQLNVYNIFEEIRNL